MYFLASAQRPDGSWEGSWGVCFTYGTWFAIAGLRAAGLPEGHPVLKAGVRFLESKQRDDGSWSESVESCRQRRYVEAETGQAVQTSWALLSLAAAGERDGEAVRRGVEFLEKRQLPDGRWPEERLAGVFNKTCAIHYDVYLRVFPVWALAACATAS